MTEYNYNKPIKITQVQILDIVKTDKSKLIVFEYDNKFFRYKYAASDNMGGIHITEYSDLNTAMHPLTHTGKEETIYNTFNSAQCTDLGNYLEYSIMHWQK